MIAARSALSDGQIRALVDEYPYAPDLSWILQTIREGGWLAANTRYLEYERARSAEAMRALMRAFSIERVDSAELAVDLLACATQVFAPAGGFTGRLLRQAPNQLRIESVDCPIYRALEETRWHSVTACPSWHRRRGWIDALHVRASDTVIREKKWGDRSCVALISIEEIL